jgi:hypothetical protein
MGVSRKTNKVASKNVLAKAGKEENEERMTITAISQTKTDKKRINRGR